jgi:hypothetical protein
MIVIIIGVFFYLIGDAICKASESTRETVSSGRAVDADFNVVNDEDVNFANYVIHKEVRDGR